MSPEDAIRLAICASPSAWFETYGRILDKRGRVVQPRANRLQTDLGQIYEYCPEHGIPCRIIILKVRQGGSSTYCVSMMYTHLRRRLAKGCILGDEYEKSVKNLVQMFERYHDNDGFDWGNTYRPQNKLFSHGSELVTETANDPRAGASGTIQFLLGTEVAHWPETGVRSAAQTLASILNCVPELPNTAVILESTPNGASGVFYETYQGAVTFEELKAGKRGNGYIKVFYAWYEHGDYEVADCTEEEWETGLRAMSPEQLDRERVMAEKFKLRRGHLVFRRRTLASPKFNWDEDLFDQEYPSDDETCFLTSGRPQFNQESLRRMEAEARVAKCDHVIFEGKFGGQVLRICSRDEAWGWIWERPRHGCRYLVTVDPMTGESQTGGKNPDAHAVLVLRLGYWQSGKWHKPKVAARVYPECRVDLDILATFIQKLSGYYGNCCVVVEANNSGLAVIELLKPMGIDLYEREVFNRRESKITTALGWQTKDGAGRDGTRSMAIGNLSALIREEGIEIPCLHILGECRTFVIRDNGKAEALPGRHDDDVMALAIGVTVEERATTYRLPDRSPFTLADREPARRRVVHNQYS